MKPGSAREGFLGKEPEEPRAHTDLFQGSETERFGLGGAFRHWGTSFFHAILGFCCIFDKGCLCDVNIDLLSLCGRKNEREKKRRYLNL